MHCEFQPKYVFVFRVIELDISHNNPSTFLPVHCQQHRLICIINPLTVQPVLTVVKQGGYDYEFAAVPKVFSVA
jgi:hypothetical protein